MLALSAAVTPFVPWILARRKAHQDAITAAQASAGASASLTLASWTALNGALQMEITRLQGVADKLQARVDRLEAEIESLQDTIRDLGDSGKHA